MRRKDSVQSLAWGLAGSAAGFFAVMCYNSYLLMSLPLGLRMVSMILVYWLIGLAPVGVAIHRKIPLSEMGFSREGLGRQIFTGLVIAFAMSAVLTLLPHLLGYGQYFSSGKNYVYMWQFAYELVYCLLAVGLTEEFVFRCFVYERFMKICGSERAAVLWSSVLFGLFHLAGGSIAQVIMTALLGAFWCVCRLKIKNCTALSLIIAHGVYDWLICLVPFVLNCIINK